VLQDGSIGAVSSGIPSVSLVLRSSRSAAGGRLAGDVVQGAGRRSPSDGRPSRKAHAPRGGTPVRGGPPCPASRPRVARRSCSPSPSEDAGRERQGGGGTGPFGPVVSSFRPGPEEGEPSAATLRSGSSWKGLAAAQGPCRLARRAGSPPAGGGRVRRTRRRVPGARERFGVPTPNPGLLLFSKRPVGLCPARAKKKFRLRSFPSRRFRALLTLFSKSFSSFPRGTCTLSVFRQCLALDGSYRPRLGCSPEQPDSTKVSPDMLPQRLSKPRGGVRGFFPPSFRSRPPDAPHGDAPAAGGETSNRTLAFSGAPFQGTWVLGRCERRTFGRLQLRERADERRAPDFGPELIPFHSQLLGESLSVSFPPSNYMLKFYG